MADYDGILTISGGRTKRANAGDTVNIKSVLKFEGLTDDDNETTLAFADPTEDRTITFPDADGEVALLQHDSLPKSISFPVKNPSTTTALTKGQIVYISGYSGNKPEVSLARSDSASTMPAFGFVANNIDAEAEGYVVSSGLFKGINTNASYNEGDTLYVSSTTAGGFVNTPPTGSGTFIQNIGKIIRADSSIGEILVGGAGRTNATPNLDSGKFFIGNGSNQSSQSAYTLPTSDGSANQVLQTNGSGALSFATADIDYSENDIIFVGGNADKTYNDFNDNGIALRWYDASTSSAKTGFFGFHQNKDAFVFYESVGTINNSAINTTIGNDGGLGKIYTSRVDLKFKGISTPTDDQIRFYEISFNGTNYIGIKSPNSLSSNYTLTLPGSDGDANQVLKTDGSGVLSWVDQSSGGIASVSADTAPSLGGDLDTDGHDIIASGNNLVVGTNTSGDLTLKTNGPGDHIFIKAEGSSSNVGIGKAFSTGGTEPSTLLHVKDTSTGYIAKIENSNSGTSASVLELVVNSLSNPEDTNDFISFKHGSSEDGKISGDDNGGINLYSVSNLELQASKVNIKSNASPYTTVAEFIPSGDGKLLFGTAAISEGFSGSEHVKIKESCPSSGGGEPGLVVIHNTNSNHSTRVLTLKGGNASSGAPTANTRFIDIFAGDGTTVVGGITGNGSGGIQLSSSFTGMHPTIIAASEVISLGLIVESTGIVWANNQNDVSTAIPKVTLTNTNNSKKVFGVISSTSSDYEGYVATWGVGESESQITVNSIGEGKVWITNINGNIENGDYITTSEISGYGRLQDDDLLHNYTVAKCTETVDWNTVTDIISHNGVDYKKYLVACTYHCG